MGSRHRNRMQFGHSGRGSSRIGRATPRTSKGSECNLPAGHSLMPRSNDDDGDRENRCIDAGRHPRDNYSSGNALDVIYGASDSNCQGEDAQDYREQSHVGRNCARESSGSGGYGRASGITPRQGCCVDSRYRSTACSNHLQGAALCKLGNIDGEFSRVRGNQIVAYRGWQNPRSAEGVREHPRYPHWRNGHCLRSYGYLLPAGARNPGVTPLRRPYGPQPPHWSCCRRAVPTLADLTHTPAPDHLVQPCNLQVGVHIGDDGGPIFPNDIYLGRPTSIQRHPCRD